MVFSPLLDQDCKKYLLNDVIHTKNFVKSILVSLENHSFKYLKSFVLIWLKKILKTK